MNDLVQYILVSIIVLAAVVAAVRTIVLTARNRKTKLTACIDCKLQDVCQKHEKNSAKKCDDKVAQLKKSQ